YRSYASGPIARRRAARIRGAAATSWMDSPARSRLAARPAPGLRSSIGGPLLGGSSGDPVGGASSVTAVTLPEGELAETGCGEGCYQSRDRGNNGAKRNPTERTPHGADAQPSPRNV